MPATCAKLHGFRGLHNHLDPNKIGVVIVNGLCTTVIHTYILEDSKNFTLKSLVVDNPYWVSILNRMKVTYI